MRVGIIGYGLTKFSITDQEIEDILLESTKTLFENTKNLNQNEIDVVLVSTNNNEKYLSSILSELAGIRPKISHSIENLCNSGTNSIVSGYSYIKSGLAKVVLIAGAEKAENSGQILQWDESRGEFKHPIFWASILTKSYKRKFGVSDKDLAVVPVKNHKFAQDNPYAISDKTCSVEDVINSKKITDELRLLDCSRSCTGAASILLAAEDVCQSFSDCPVWIKGIGQKTISAGFTKNNELFSMESTKLATIDAFKMAGLEAKNIDVAEVHDAFSVCEPMAIESIGISDKGKGAKDLKQLNESDDRKINPRGGLIGSGHPLGATGIAQTIEITQQLQGMTGKRQVEGAEFGLVHNMSAAATSSTILVLER